MFHEFAHTTLLSDQDAKTWTRLNELALYEIVYYAPREEKIWTVHISYKFPPEPKTRVANTRCGLANFTPVERILFFTIPGPKIPHSRL